MQFIEEISKIIVENDKQIRSATNQCAGSKESEQAKWANTYVSLTVFQLLAASCPFEKAMDAWETVFPFINYRISGETITVQGPEGGAALQYLENFSSRYSQKLPDIGEERLEKWAKHAFPYRIWIYRCDAAKKLRGLIGSASTKHTVFILMLFLILHMKFSDVTYDDVEKKFHGYVIQNKIRAKEPLNPHDYVFYPSIKNGVRELKEVLEWEVYQAACKENPLCAILLSQETQFWFQLKTAPPHFAISAARQFPNLNNAVKSGLDGILRRQCGKKEFSVFQRGAKACCFDYQQNLLHGQPELKFDFRFTEIEDSEEYQFYEKLLKNKVSDLQENLPQKAVDEVLQYIAAYRRAVSATYAYWYLFGYEFAHSLLETEYGLFHNLLEEDVEFFDEFQETYSETFDRYYTKISGNPAGRAGQHDALFEKYAQMEDCCSFGGSELDGVVNERKDRAFYALIALGCRDFCHYRASVKQIREEQELVQIFEQSYFKWLRAANLKNMQSALETAPAPGLLEEKIIRERAEIEAILKKQGSLQKNGKVPWDLLKVRYEMECCCAKYIYLFGYEFLSCLTGFDQPDPYNDAMNRRYTDQDA